MISERVIRIQAEAAVRWAQKYSKVVPTLEEAKAIERDRMEKLQQDIANDPGSYFPY